MWSLALKDAYTCKKEILIYLGIVFALSCSLFIPWSCFVDNDGINKADILVYISRFVSIFLIFCFCLPGIQKEFIKNDEHKGFKYFRCTTSGLTKSIVKERYVMNLFVNCIVTLWCLVIIRISYIINNAKSAETAFILALFLYNVFICALEIPFYMRFGLIYGNYYRIGIVFAIILGVIIYGLYGDISKLLSIDKLWDWLYKFNINKFLKSNIKLFLTLSAVDAVLYFISFKISRVLYKRSIEDL